MESVAGILFTLYRGTPQHGEWVLACLEGAWPALLGDRLAAVCRPLRFDESWLTIEILDPAWKDALKGMQPDLRDKIRTATCDEVRQISFQMAAAPGPPS